MEHIGNMTNGINTILILEEENKQLTAPWKHSLIIELLDKKLSNEYIREKLMEMWNITENFPLIDLGIDFS